LVLGEHAAISNRHMIDCTARVVIGRFTTFAGFYSQILTHSIDLEKGRQSSEPVEIGEYSFVGTNCILLGGSVLPDRSVLAAKSLLNKKHSEPQTLYGGVPAKPIKALPANWAYFQRTAGFVD
jgi:acetyltransferase-like isoleucine patch superfamily enzyme